MSNIVRATVRALGGIALTASLVGLSACSEEGKEKWGEAGEQSKEAAAAVGEAVKESAVEAEQRIESALGGQEQSGGTETTETSQ